MTKAIIIILLTILTSTVLFFTYLWLVSLRHPPAYGDIVEKYYVCREHQILQGGIFGKGPTRKFAQKNGKTWCWRGEWDEIDRKTFKQLAVQWYGVNWAEDTPYWQHD